MSDTQAQSVFAPEGPIDVLHVDDDDQFADTLAEYLEEVFGGFRVTHVETAADALAVVEQSAGAGVSDGSVDTGVSASNVDCIVSDYRLPGMDGLELSEAVAQRQSGVPFLLLTGRGSESVASEAMETAVTGYLPKRGDREGFGRLADRIRSAVERTHTRVSYREVFDKAGVGLTVRDTDTGRLLAVNDAYCELLGHDRDELLAGRADVLLDGV
ncbi:MAG: response regulator, partial [Halobaculum sp.]